jgi:Rrf2 family nitric oxide-sensitive transcriptional repressor
MYLGCNRDRLVTVQDIADLHHISKNHLMKIVYHLGVSGVVETVRGRNGGLRLRSAPEDINIGAVIRKTESDFFIVECFDQEHNACVLTPFCRLKGLLRRATDAFLNTLDSVTLAELIDEKNSAIQRPEKSQPPRPSKSK